jgi:hypothetical protein
MVVSCFGPSEWGFIQSSHGRHGQRLGETVSAPKCFEVVEVAQKLWLNVSDSFGFSSVKGDNC